MTQPKYEQAYWRAVHIREQVGNGTIKIPYARSRTIGKIDKLLAEIMAAPWEDSK